jgi:predicted N-acyltransferase
VHITFSTAEEWAELGARGFQQRRGIQYHWENNGYSTFEDFLADLKQSKRKSIRQVRECVAAKSSMEGWEALGACRAAVRAVSFRVI